MNQVKIGKFIAERRKIMGYTQMQLAEKLGITDRAVSKWETGRAMPDSSIMIELCGILKTSVTDLLSGEIVTKENCSIEIENKLLEAVKAKEESDRHLLLLEWVIAILSILIIFVPITIAALVPMEEWIQTVIIFSGFIPGIIGFSFAIKIEQVAGYYECKNCGNRYVPTYKSINMSAHLGRTRYMTCPKCKKRSWQRKCISKGDNQ